LRIAVAVALVVVLSFAAIWLVDGPLGADGDASPGSGERRTGLLAVTERSGDRTQVTVIGRLRAPEGPGPATVWVLARRDTGEVCPLPRVAPTAAISPPAGSIRVAWRREVGPAPGDPLTPGLRIRMVGTIANGPARRLCVHLVRGGDRIMVLRSAVVRTPGATGGADSGLDTPLEEDALLLGILSVMVVAIVAGVLAIGVVEGRRRGRSFALPALPLDVRIPDAPPADDDGPGPGRSGRLRTLGRRRLAAWRESRRRQADAAGELWDPNEPPPWHLALLTGGDGAERIAADRFDALSGLYPSVRVLHDRRIPGPRGLRVDHVFVGPAGVVVAQSERWSGYVQIQGRRLLVDGRDRAGAVHAVVKRVEAVRGILETAGFAGLPIQGVLHCVETEDVLLDGSLHLRDVPLLDALGTIGRAVDGDVMGEEDVRRLVAALERRLPAA
jgi:hypothetical protein